MATLAELESRRQQLLSLIRFSQSVVSSERIKIERYNEELQTASGTRASDLLDSKQNSLVRIKQEEDNLARYQAELSLIEAQIATLQTQATPQPVAKESTGETVTQAQTANANGADVQNPNTGPKVVTAEGRVTPAVTTVATNAEKFEPVADVGTDSPVRKQSQLMSTPAATAATPIAPNPGGPYPTQTPGIATPGDDQRGGVSPNTPVRAQIETLFGSSTAGPIIPEPNILNQYANYTYNISLYIMSPVQYKKMIQNKSKNIAGFQLLMRSGGAPVAGGFAPLQDPQEVEQIADGNATGVTAQQLGRNQFFPLDYYIDDVRLETLCQGKGTGQAHNATALSFKIIEPNGLSLFDNLYRAAQQYNALQPEGAGRLNQNYAAQNYLMVIRFYGYDKDGNLARPEKTTGTSPGSDPNAIVEKFIPFQFRNINFRIANRLTEYSCDCATPQQTIGMSQGRGKIPYNVEISSQTLRELFVGNLNFSSATPTGDGRQVAGTVTANVEDAQLGATTVTAGNSSAAPAPPKATSASTPAFTTGLASALNKYEEELVDKKKLYTYPDTYEIVFPQGAEIIADAKVIPPGNLNKQAIAFNSKTGATAADLKNPNKSTPNTNSKVTNATAGMSIMQFLDQYIRTSTYIYDQQTKIINPKDPTAPPIPQGSPAGVTAWYNITVEATPKQYDPKRNDFAYHIVYRISPFKVNDLRSDWFPLSKYQGTQKIYSYWFTGQNTEILQLEQDFNYLYYLVLSGAQSNAGQGLTTSYRESIKKIFQPNSNESSQGITNSQVNEPSANAADSLNSPSDQATIKIKIVGDPAWIQQGELWSGVSGLQMDYRPFLPDGTINFAAQEALFEVRFNKPVDYDLQTGLMDASQNNFGANRPDGNPGIATQSYVYRARSVINYFSRGRFEQELDGTIVLYPLGSDTNIAQNARTISNVEDIGLESTTTRPGTLSNVEDAALARPDLVSGSRPFVPSAFNNAVNSALGTGSSSAPGSFPTLYNTNIGTAPLGPAAPAAAPTSGTQVLGSSAPTTGTNPPSNFGAVPGIGDVTALNSYQQQLVILRSQRELAVNRGDIRQVANLDAQIADIEQQLLRQAPPPPNVGLANQVMAKENG